LRSERTPRPRPEARAAGSGYHGSDRSVATIGRVEPIPGAANVVPSRVELTRRQRPRLPHDRGPGRLHHGHPDLQTATVRTLRDPYARVLRTAAAIREIQRQVAREG
jgi:hypothetical protein